MGSPEAWGRQKRERALLAGRICSSNEVSSNVSDLASLVVSFQTEKVGHGAGVEEDAIILNMKAPSMRPYDSNILERR